MLLHWNISFAKLHRIRFCLFRQQWWTPCQLTAYTCTQVSGSDRLQGVTHCYEILLNNIKTASSNQISSLRVVCRRTAALVTVWELRRLGKVHLPNTGGEDRTTSPPVEGKVYCSSNLCMQRLKLWLMQVELVCWAQRDYWEKLQVMFDVVKCELKKKKRKKDTQSILVWADITQ